MKENRQSLSALLKRMEILEGELSDIRKNIAEYMIPPSMDIKETKDVNLQFTLNDLFEAFGRKHKSYAVRLRHALEKQGITTLTQFLNMTIGQLLDLDGIGPATLEHINKAMKQLGISW